VGLDEVDLALVDQGHRALIDVDANHLDAPAGDRRGRGETDIAEADDGNLTEGMPHEEAPWLCVRWRVHRHRDCVLAGRADTPPGRRAAPTPRRRSDRRRCRPAARYRPRPPRAAR